MNDAIAWACLIMVYGAAVYWLCSILKGTNDERDQDD